MKKIQTTLQVLVLAAILAGSATFAQTYTPPSAPPPGGNVAAPVNVGSVTQEKAGTLGFLKGFYSFGTAFISPSGTKTDWPDFSNLALAINGNVGAKSYCDDYGKNCFFPLNVNEPLTKGGGVCRWHLKPPHYRSTVWDGATLAKGGMTPDNRGLCFGQAEAGKTGAKKRLGQIGCPAGYIPVMGQTVASYDNTGEKKMKMRTYRCMLSRLVIDYSAYEIKEDELEDDLGE
jgi:hypothetical protein